MSSRRERHRLDRLGMHPAFQLQVERSRSHHQCHSHHELLETTQLQRTLGWEHCWRVVHAGPTLLEASGAHLVTHQLQASNLRQELSQAVLSREMLCLSGGSLPLATDEVHQIPPPPPRWNPRLQRQSRTHSHHRRRSPPGLEEENSARHKLVPERPQRDHQHVQPRCWLQNQFATQTPGDPRNPTFQVSEGPLQLRSLGLVRPTGHHLDQSCLRLCELVLMGPPSGGQRARTRWSRSR
mmetsp:Transcript_20169/g.53797  ORF Transcript_20169/g.53797 Transcript_20169/m.53797 type:complete len:239 (-) Transcript_20169:334-1050(-)